MTKLIIEILAFQQGKSFGFQEYAFNLLNYFYTHAEELMYDEIYVICLKGQEQYLAKYVNKFIIKTYTCKFILMRYIKQTLMPIHLRVSKDDVIVFTGNYSSLLKRSKHILVIHDLLFKHKAWLPNRLMRYQRELFVPKSIALADKIICISKFTEKEVLKYYPTADGKTEVIYNYFNFQKFPIYSDICKENSFISVCSSAYHKNTFTVLKAFQEYCLRGGSYGLILVGALEKGSASYSLYDEFDEAIQRRIQIYSKIDNNKLSELYSKAKAYISASLFEGLGMPIVEAMYFNLPVILTDDEVFHEISLDKGIYFNPMDYLQLSKIMQRVENEECIFNSYMVQNKYSETNTSAKYLSILNSLSSKNRTLYCGK